MFKNLSRILKNNKGVSIVEFLVALGLSAVLITSGLEVLGPSLRVEQQSKENEQVASLLQEHFEIIRSIRNENWNALSPELEIGETWAEKYPDCEDAVDTYHWEDIEGEGAGLQLIGCSRNFGKYEVVITFDDVYRDANGEIVDSGGELDSETRKVNVQIDWETYGREKTVLKSIYLTNWGGF